MDKEGEGSKKPLRESNVQPKSGDNNQQIVEEQNPSVALNEENKPSDKTISEKKKIEISPARKGIQKSEFAKVLEDKNIKELCRRKFTFHKQFRSTLTVDILQMNFDSVRVMLHYGNLRREASVLYVAIKEQIMEKLPNKQKGNFGIVTFSKIQNEVYAFKGIRYSYTKDFPNLHNIYRQFFLCSVADILEAGPVMKTYGGYDIIIFGQRAYFAMEKCQQVNNFSQQDCEILQQQLRNSLQEIHSINLVHLDIKPLNLAKSLQFNKAIFLDYGLSRIIKQNRGEKIKTMFVGTYAYASQQMKKCNSIPDSVDFYQNDEKCLDKTMKSLREQISHFKIDEGFEYYDPSDQSGQQNIDVFTQALLIIKLKTYIEQKNLSKILEFHKNGSVYYLLSVQQLLSNQLVSESIRLNEDVKAILKQTRQDIIKSKFEIQLTDKRLSKYYQLRSSKPIVEKIMPISKFPKKQSYINIFENMRENPEFMQKIFHFFHPFCADRNFNKCKSIKWNIVAAIHKMSRRSKKLFYSQRIRKSIIFFYQYFKQFPYYNILLYFRLLFISIQQINYLDEIQPLIVQLIKDPFFKILTLCEFLLFRIVLFRQKIYEWDKKVILRHLSANASNKQFCFQNQQPIWIVFCIQKKPKQTKHKHVISKKSEKASIYRIKYLFIEIRKFDPTFFPALFPQNDRNESPRGIQLKIYEKYFSWVKVQDGSYDQMQLKFFWSVRCEYEDLNFRNRKQRLKTLTRRHFSMLVSRNEPISVLLETAINLNYFQIREVKTILIKIIQAKIYFQQCPAEILEIHKRLQIIELGLQYMAKSMPKNNKITDITHTTETTETLRIDFVQSLKVNLRQFNPSAKQLIQKILHLQLRKNILEIKLQFYQGKNQSELLQKIMQVSKQFQFSIENQTGFQKFFPLLSLLPQNQMTSSEINSLKALLSQIGQFCLQKGFLYVFEKMPSVLHQFILNSKQRGIEKNVGYLLEIIEYCKKKYYSFNVKVNFKILELAVDAFCANFQPQELKNIRLKNQNNMSSCSLLAYFVWKITFEAQKQNKIIFVEFPSLKAQIKKIIDHFQNMPQLLISRVKEDLRQIPKRKDIGDRKEEQQRKLQNVPPNELQ